jgi:hypothetical protein
MASNKTKSVKKVAPKAKAKTPAKAKAAPKAKVKAAPVKPAARHPKARVAEAHGTKAALAHTVAQAIARADEDAGALEARLKTASNAQLLRLSRASQTLKQKFGDREKLIAAIGAAAKKTTDKDYLAKLDSYSLPQLLDLAAAAQRAS